MTEMQQREQFSIAYVSAVAAAAKINIYRLDVDEDSIDIGFNIKSVAGSPISPKIDAQIKCVSLLNLVGEVYRYPLKLKNYEELIGDHYVPRILIVVEAPAHVNAWLDQNHDRLMLHRCGYWASLQSCQPVENNSSVTVSLPRVQVFSPAALKNFFTDGVQP
jgi:hypothetical protein